MLSGIQRDAGSVIDLSSIARSGQPCRIQEMHRAAEPAKPLPIVRN